MAWLDGGEVAEGGEGGREGGREAREGWWVREGGSEVRGWYNNARMCYGYTV